MTLSEIKAHIFRRTKTNANSFPAADMVIAINNAIERVESKIRSWISEYTFTRFTTTDLSTGTAEPKFYSGFHELVPLWAEYQYAAENGLKTAPFFLSEIQMKDEEMERWYGLRNYRIATVTIASPGVFTLNNHGLSTDDRVIFETSGALPTGLSASTWYYAIYASDSTFKVSATLGGTAINTTGSQSGTHLVGRERSAGFTHSADSTR